MTLYSLLTHCVFLILPPEITFQSQSQSVFLSFFTPFSLFHPLFCKGMCEQKVKKRVSFSDPLTSVKEFESETSKMSSQLPKRYTVEITMTPGPDPPAPVTQTVLFNDVPQLTLTFRVDITNRTRVFVDVRRAAGLGNVRHAIRFYGEFSS